MKINPYQALAVAIALIAATLLAEVLKPRELMAKQTASLNIENAIPQQFGDWKMVPGVGVVTPTEVVEVADPNEEANKIYSQEVSRTYTDREGHIVMLLVAYGPVQNNRLKAHRPEICYAAAGFRVSEKFVTSLKVGGNQMINLTRLVTQRETRFEPVTYWMRFGNDIVTGVVDRQLARIKYGLHGLIPDGALVRFSTIGVDRAQSFAIQDRFIQDFLNSIEPSKRPFFAGA